MNQNKQKINNFDPENLFELATVLSQQIEFQEIVRIITQKSIQLLNADIALVLLVNPQTQDTIKTLHTIAENVVAPHLHRVQNQVSGWILYHDKPFLSQDIMQDKRFKNANFKDISISSVLGVPLTTESFTIGSLIFFNQNRDKIFSQNDLEYAKKIAQVATPYLRNVEKLQHYFQAPLNKDAIVAKYEKDNLIGKSESYVSMLHSVEVAAKCDVKVLLEGETGTGKELLARAIHNHSERSDLPYVALDCGSIPEQLLESELFGHIKGSFTGATQDRKGIFQQANYGTLFLDEIANLPLDLQAKLLRVLQEGEVRSVGEDVPTKIDVRIITAASESLRSLVDEGKFRKDLYFRLYVYPIMVPKLSDRKPDIPLLARHFLKKFSKEQNKNVDFFHPEITSYMKIRTWTGNIRELENFVERLVTVCDAKLKDITPLILPPDLRKDFEANKDSISRKTIRPLQESIAKFERKIIRQALEVNNWNQSETARHFQISEGTLRYKLKKLNIYKNKM
jgi:transcriptional regulator with GAF, ATPase, and Fis domain